MPLGPGGLPWTACPGFARMGRADPSGRRASHEAFRTSFCRDRRVQTAQRRREDAKAAVIGPSNGTSLRLFVTRHRASLETTPGVPFADVAAHACETCAISSTAGCAGILAVGTSRRRTRTCTSFKSRSRAGGRHHRRNVGHWPCHRTDGRAEGRAGPSRKPQSRNARPGGARDRGRRRPSRLRRRRRFGRERCRAYRPNGDRALRRLRYLGSTTRERRSIPASPTCPSTSTGRSSRRTTGVQSTARLPPSSISATATAAAGLSTSARSIPTSRSRISAPTRHRNTPCRVSRTRCGWNTSRIARPCR